MVSEIRKISKGLGLSEEVVETAEGYFRQAQKSDGDIEEAKELLKKRLTAGISKKDVARACVYTASREYKIPIIVEDITGTTTFEGSIKKEGKKLKTSLKHLKEEGLPKTETNRFFT